MNIDELNGNMRAALEVCGAAVTEWVLRQCRKRHAQAIASTPEQFKVCDQCGSISFKHAGTCSVCGAWRFNETIPAVLKAASALSAYGEPKTSGTLPRIFPPQQPRFF